MEMGKRIGRFARPFTQSAVLLLASAAVLSACGSSTPTTSTTTNPPKTSTTQKTTAASCTTPLLHLTATFGGAAAGGSYYRFNAENIGPSKCVINGYPTLMFFAPSAAGGAGSTSPVTLTITDTGPGPSNVDLAPHASAEFLLLFTDVPVNGAGCSTVGSINVTPPHQTGSTPVALSFSPCGGVVKVYAFGPSGTENP